MVLDSENSSRRADALSVDICVQIIEAVDFPKVHTFYQSKFYIVMRVGEGREEYTSHFKVGDHPVKLDHTFTCEAHRTSVLYVKVFCAHKQRPGPDHLIAEYDFLILESSRNKEITMHLRRPPSGIVFSKLGSITARISVIKRPINIPPPSPSRRSLSIFEQRSPVDEANTVLNNAKRISPSWEKFIRTLEAFVNFGEKIAEINDTSKVAFRVVSFVCQAVRGQIMRDEKVEGLIDTIESLYAFFLESKPLETMTFYKKTVNRLLTLTTDCAYFIAEYYKIKSFSDRLLLNTILKPDDIIDDYTTSFMELKIELITGITLHSALMTVLILQKVERIENTIHVATLHILPNKSWDSGHVCLRGTRDDVLDDIFQWTINTSELESSSTSRIYLLVGERGTGKSSIAHTVAQRFHEQRRLASGVFLSQMVCADDLRVITSTIAHELAAYHDVIKERMAKIIARDPAIVSASVDRQFSDLIVETTSGMTMIGPSFIIIDGLHECDDPQKLHLFFRTLVQASLGLPSSFKIIITLRPSPDLESIFRQNPNCHRRDIQFDAAGSLYSPQELISNELSLLASAKSCIFTPDGDLSFAEVKRKFLKRVMGMHLWASTACDTLKYCSPKDARRFLTLLFSNHSPKRKEESIRHLYDALLNTFLPDLPISGCTIGWSDFFASIIMNSRLTLPTFVMECYAILDSSEPEGAAVSGINLLQKVGCIYEDATNSMQPYKLHPSFQDFLTDDQWDTLGDVRFHVNIEAPHSVILAGKCLDCLNNLLRHNICYITDPSLPNTDIRGLDSLVRQNAPNGLIYASKFWIENIIDSAPDSADDALIAKLEVFLKMHLLHWIELLSILSLSDYIEESLEKLDKWLRRFVLATDSKLIITRDAIQFMQLFSKLISKYALHTYISALPLLPVDTTLSQIYQAEEIPERPNIVESNITQKWKCTKTLKGHRGYVNSISLDQSRLLSASHDLSIRLWDSQSGNITRVLEGHANLVYCAALSPNGLEIASCSADKTICLWDTESGSLKYKSAKQHEKWARFIAYSPDGKMLVTCTIGKDVHLWDTQLKPAGALVGHKDAVRSAEFSFTSLHLASASKDRTVRIWDLQQKMQCDTLRGHDDIVYDVAWSPNASQLASCSADRTIRLWDVGTGETVHILKGHTDWVRCVSYSPHGSRVISGSSDSTVRIWDTMKGIQIGRSLRGHTKVVTSVAFYPDGEKVVSASYDYDLRIWSSLNGIPRYLSPPALYHRETPRPSNVNPPTIIYRGNFKGASGRYAQKTDPDGWICTANGIKLIWTPYPKAILISATGSFTIRSSEDEVLLVLSTLSSAGDI